MVRSVRDACSCVTVTPSVQVQSPQKQSLDGGDPNVRVSTRRAKEKFNAAVIPNVEAAAVAVSPGIQETLAMLQAGLLAASTSASAGEWKASAQ